MFIEKNTILHLTNQFGAPALPTDIDLASSEAPMLLAQLEVGLTGLSARQRQDAVRALSLTVPAPELHGHGLCVLPGGALALRCGVEGVLVCDPQTAAALHAAAATRLQTRLRQASGVQTITHGARGLRLHNGVPATLPRQACSILQDATVLENGWAGRAVVQWRPHGAVIWQLADAPQALTLAASVSGLTLEPGARALPASVWQVGNQAECVEKLGPGLFERISDLLIDDVGDALRHALAEHAVAGEDGLAARLAQALRVLPAHFSADPAADAGEQLLRGWPRADAQLTDPCADLVLIGLERGDNQLDALRDVLNNEGLFFTEANQSTLVALGSQAARRVADQNTGVDFCGVLIAQPADPQTLYALAANLAEQTGGRVVMAAPCWNFYHRIDAQTGEEAGNAHWFGMGAGLDELDWL